MRSSDSRLFSSSDSAVSRCLPAFFIVFFELAMVLFAEFSSLLESFRAFLALSQAFCWFFSFDPPAFMMDFCSLATVSSSSFVTLTHSAISDLHSSTLSRSWAFFDKSASDSVLCWRSAGSCLVSSCRVVSKPSISICNLGSLTDSVLISLFSERISSARSRRRTRHAFNLSCAALASDSSFLQSSSDVSTIGFTVLAPFFPFDNFILPF
mmetsp:Transcript_14603/g.33901  ORF Transcript_14603/g.33901 Transcript_14603/m.33901 type:complete len:210 (-) Transcript_14603:274-903(-)